MDVKRGHAALNCIVFSTPPFSLLYQNADVIAQKELEQYSHEDGADKRPCHNDLLLCGFPSVLNLTRDIEVIQAGLGVRLGLTLIAVLRKDPVTKKRTASMVLLIILYTRFEVWC